MDIIKNMSSLVFVLSRKPASEHELPTFILLIFSILHAKSNFFNIY